MEGFKTGDVDLSAVQPAVEAYLTEVLGPEVHLSRWMPLAAGACQENFRVDVAKADDARTYVLRSDAAFSLPGSLSRRDEYEVTRAARRAGVLCPDVRGLVTDLLRPKSYAYLLDWIEGTSLGARIVKDPELAEARRALPRQLAECLSRIHAIRPDEHALPLPRPIADDAVEGALAFQREVLDRLPEARPGLELAFRWLEQHRPPPSELVLVHGDFRNGNFMVGPEGLRGVLDWEFAHWGAPEEDLAWVVLRDWRFGRVEAPVGGFAPRSALYRAYEAESGRTLDPEVLHFWEVVGNLRWATGAIVQGQRYSGGNLDLELVAIARRSIEMEYEALRLIDAGPSARWRDEEDR